MPPSLAVSARRVVGVLVAALVLGASSGCSSRQGRADAATADVLPFVVSTLERTARANWSRPSTPSREALAEAGVVYRVLAARPDGSTSIAVWHVDRGRTIWSQDQPRVGLACARVGTAVPLTSEPEDCPAGLPVGASASGVDAESLDWSDESLAHDQARLDIRDALADAQWGVKDGTISTVADLVRQLEASGLTVRPRRGSDPSTLRAEVSRRATGPRLSDTAQRASGRVCATVGAAVDREDPYYAVDSERPC